MASSAEKGEETRLQNLHKNQRASLNDAYAQLEAEKNTQTLSAFTFEEALDNQIQAISGESTKIRPNELDRVDRIYNNLLEAVEVIKKVPPEQFLTPDSLKDVNTEEEFQDAAEAAVEAALGRRATQDEQ